MTGGGEFASGAPIHTVSGYPPGRARRVELLARRPRRRDLVNAIPDDRCQRCTAPLHPHDARLAERDRVCERCAATARKRGETVTRIDPDGR